MKYIIAEIGQNFIDDNGKKSLDIAKLLIREAKRVDCDAVKFQFYDASLIYNEDDPNIIHAKETQLTIENAKELFYYAENRGIDAFFSVFNVNLYKELLDAIPSIKYLKIASRTNIDKTLMRAAHNDGIPMIISLGMNPYPVDCYDLWYPGSILLYCVAEYPASIRKYGDVEYGRYDGISDHTVGIDILGLPQVKTLEYYEKHFILNKYTNTPDAKCSLTPSEMKEYVRILRDND